MVENKRISIMDYEGYANKDQCKLLRKMIDNHSNRVMSSYMEGNNLIIETEDGEKCFVLPNGKKFPKLYKIERSCDTDGLSGWMIVDIATSHDQSKAMKKHWQHYLGKEVKVRVRI
jgi:hypothetical protein